MEPPPPRRAPSSEPERRPLESPGEPLLIEVREAVLAWLDAPYVDRRAFLKALVKELSSRGLYDDAIDDLENARHWTVLLNEEGLI